MVLPFQMKFTGWTEDAPPGPIYGVIPAEAGIQFQAADASAGINWIPAFAGMTKYLLGRPA
jgi:hypothetical protein